mgnify:CR=1 FL=1
MKKFICLLLVLSMLFGITGCSSAPEETIKDSEPIEGETGSSEIDETKEASDTLTIAVASDITSLDPHVGKEVAAVVVTNNIYATLLTLDENGEVAPYVAESWNVVDDKTIDFKIREDITFHDGSKLTAEDVAFSLNRAIESKYISYIINYASNAEVIDEYNVRLHLNAPYVGSLINLTVPFTAIVPKAVVEANENALIEKPIGCGPYEFVEWEHGNYCKIKAYDGYFMDKAKTENIIFRIIPEGAQRTIALETGEVDLVYDLPVNELSIVKDNENLQLYSTPSLNTWYISMNNDKEPLSDIRVRQAIRYSINAQEIIDSILYGAGEVANSIVPPAATGYVEGVPAYEQDIEKAKQLLADAGYPDGLNLSLAVAEDTTRVAVCQVIQNQLAKAGINVKIDIYDSSTYYDHANKGEFDLAFYFWICAAGHADYQYYSLLHSSQKGPGGNRSFYDNDKADAYIEAARNTLDTKVSLENYKKLEEIVYEESPNAILCYTNLNVGASRKVDGFVMQPAGYHNLETVVVYK